MKTILAFPRPVLHTACLMVTCLTISVALPAQNTPTTTPNNKTQPPPQDTYMNDRGWTFFDDRVRKDLDIDDAKMKELRTIDDSYRTRYNAMGATPWTSTDYGTLTNEREARVRKVLTPAQYDRWYTTYGSGRGARKTTPMPQNEIMNK